MVAAPTAVSLFSSAGIGDAGLLASGFQIIASNELLEDRHALYDSNFPNTKCFTGDLYQCGERLISYTRNFLEGRELDLILATPPCQGMSTNGVGKLLAEVRAGNRGADDPRNRLVIPTMQVVKALRPKWVVFENVPGMKDTLIVGPGSQPIRILDFIRSELGPDYVGCAEVVSCTDYGLPQTRKRLITIYTRTREGKLIFNKNSGSFLQGIHKSSPKTLRQAIGHLPPLDPLDGPLSCTEVHPLHSVQPMDAEKHRWLRHTPAGETAFNNQCTNPKCGFDRNPRHRDRTIADRANGAEPLPITCIKCGDLLPRPWTIDKKTGAKRAISGFHSAYRRMRWDEPARALTRNFPYEASDNKVHPDQHRPLSPYEAIILQSISDYPYSFEVNGELVSRSLIADSIGESVPPRLIEAIAKLIVSSLKVSRRSKMQISFVQND